jgi:hypothetical protein
MSKQSEERRAYWRSVLERQRTSGLSVRQFCREERVSEASFHSWKRKIAGQDRHDAAFPEEGDEEHPAKKQAARQSQKAVFIPVRLSAAASGVLEVVHPRGHVVRVPAVFDEGALGQILDVLDHRGSQ